MTLHPNRPGGLRGPGGGTLDQVIAAIDLLGVALGGPGDGGRTLGDVVNELALLRNTLGDVVVALNGLTVAMGSPADTDCGLSQLELLCAIATTLGVDTGPTSQAPPILCPGYGPDPDDYYRLFTWQADTVSIADPPNTYYGVVEAGPAPPPSLYVSTFNPYPSEPSFVVNAIRTTTNLTNVCFSMEKTGGVFVVNIARYDAPSGDLLGVEVLHSTAADNGTFSKAIGFSADQILVVTLSQWAGNPPDPNAVRVWATQGAFG